MHISYTATVQAMVIFEAPQVENLDRKYFNYFYGTFNFTELVSSQAMADKHHVDKIKLWLKDAITLTDSIPKELSRCDQQILISKGSKFIRLLQRVYYENWFMLGT